MSPNPTGAQGQLHVKKVSSQFGHADKMFQLVHCLECVAYFRYVQFGIKVLIAKAFITINWLIEKRFMIYTRTVSYVVFT